MLNIEVPIVAIIIKAIQTHTLCVWIINNVINEAALIIHPITDNSFFPIFDASFVINVESKSITIVPERLAIDIAFILPK